jgi:glycosyltransferase involved in cell wall biosynthesis
MPQIAAIICTHNRDNYLGAAIDSLIAQECDDFEILVVDNGSTDSTKAVVESRLSHPRLKYVYESVLGLSVARNTGAKETTSPILAYLDDDAEASPQWLSVLLEAYNNNEKLAIAGGKVTLIWPDGIMPPKWISSDMAAGLGAYDLGESIVYIDNPNLTPRGLNYSMRRAFLEQIGGFDANLGRVGKKLLSNEELYMP